MNIIMWQYVHVLYIFMYVHVIFLQVLKKSVDGVRLSRCG
jgi:hypothetical protein